MQAPPAETPEDSLPKGRLIARSSTSDAMTSTTLATPSRITSSLATAEPSSLTEARESSPRVDDQRIEAVRQQFVSHMLAAFSLLQQTVSAGVDPSMTRNETEAVAKTIAQEASAALAVITKHQKEAISTLPTPAAEEVSASQGNSIDLHKQATEHCNDDTKAVDLGISSLNISQVVHPAFINGGWAAKTTTEDKSVSSNTASEGVLTPTMTPSPGTVSSSVFAGSSEETTKPQSNPVWWGVEAKRGTCHIHPGMPHDDASCHKQQKRIFPAGSCSKHPASTDHDSASCRFLQRLKASHCNQYASTAGDETPKFSSPSADDTGSTEATVKTKKEPTTVQASTTEASPDNTGQSKIEPTEIQSQGAADWREDAIAEEQSSQNRPQSDSCAASSEPAESEGSATPKALGTPSRLSSPDAVVITGYENSGEGFGPHSPNSLGLSPLAQPFSPVPELQPARRGVGTDYRYPAGAFPESSSIAEAPHDAFNGRSGILNTYGAETKALPPDYSKGASLSRGRFNASVASYNNSSSLSDSGVMSCASPAKTQAFPAHVSVLDDPGPMYPFMFRSLQRRWPRSDKELIEFSRVWKGDVPTKKLGERSHAPELSSIETSPICIHKLIDQLTWALAQESYGSCHCQIAGSQRARAMRRRESIGSTNDTMTPPEGINKENMSLKYGASVSDAGHAMSEFGEPSGAASNHGIEHVQNLR